MLSLRYWFVAGLVISAPAFGQRQIAIEITHRGNDPAGQLLVAEMRQTIRVSEGALVSPSRRSEGAEDYHVRLTSELSRPRIRLQLLTAAAESTASSAVFVSVVYDSPDMALSGAFIRSMVETCAPDDTASCARRILEKASTSMDWLRDNWPSLWKTLY